MRTQARIRSLKRLMAVTPPESYIFFNYARELAAVAAYLAHRERA